MVYGTQITIVFMGFINHSCLIIHLVPRIQPTHPVETCPLRRPLRAPVPNTSRSWTVGRAIPMRPKSQHQMIHWLVVEPYPEKSWSSDQLG